MRLIKKTTFGGNLDGDERKRVSLVLKLGKYGHNYQYI
jgi:hypothetical protein